MAWNLKLLALFQLANCYSLFDSPSDLPDYIPQTCREALSRDIDCPFIVWTEAVEDLDGVKGKFYYDTGDSYCADPCRHSLGGFLENVVAACGDFKDGLWENMSEANSAMEFADSILRTQRHACLEEEQENVPHYFREQMLRSTPNSRLVADTQDTCKGAIYTVKKGDTCQSISKAMSVATDRLIERNGLTYTCSDLLEGRSLCIEDACEVTMIKQGQTCEDFVKWKWFSTIQLQSWNPTLKPLCNSQLIPNLDAMAGRYICIGPPGEFNGPEPSHTQPAKGKWRIETPTCTKLAKATTTPEPATTIEPLKPYNTRPAQVDADSDAADSKAEYTKYCWLTGERWDYTLDSDGPSEDCQSLMDEYCTFHPERPSPTVPSYIPESCTPGSSVDEL